MKRQKTQNSQHNIEGEQSQRPNMSGLQDLVYNYSNQGGVVLAKAWTNRSVEQNRNPRNRPTQIWSIDLGQRKKSI